MNQTSSQTTRKPIRAAEQETDGKAQIYHAEWYTGKSDNDLSQGCIAHGTNLFSQTVKNNGRCSIVENSHLLQHILKPPPLNDGILNLVFVLQRSPQQVHH